MLLEPICEIHIYVPNAYTAKVQGLISKRRGQILGFDAKEGWPGWDDVAAHMPQAELHDIIIELRSLTFGVGTYEWKFDHLSELDRADCRQRGRQPREGRVISARRAVP